MKHLAKLENSISQKISVTVLSEYWQVDEYINKSQKEHFDFILLDRDCKLGGSFHILDLDKISKSTIIGISSIPKYNQELINKGVKLIILKNYNDLEKFAIQVIDTIENNINHTA